MYSVRIAERRRMINAIEVAIVEDVSACHRPRRHILEASLRFPS